MSIAKDECQPTRGSPTQGMIAPSPSPRLPGPCDLLLGGSFPPGGSRGCGRQTGAAHADLHHSGSENPPVPPHPRAPGTGTGAAHRQQWDTIPISLHLQGPASPTGVVRGKGNPKSSIHVNSILSKLGKLLNGTSLFCPQTHK